MNTVPVQEFDAQYRIKYTNGRVEWHPCRVVGVHVPDQWSQGVFIILIEDEGETYTGTAEAVRRL